MFIIPGFLITWLTFPGVIVHELGHQLMCQLTGTPVREVCYFRFGEPAGYVIHELPTSIWKHLLIGFGPLIVNTTLGFLLGLLATQNEHLGSVVLVQLAMWWLAVSVAMHSFPSRGDASSLWQSLWGDQSSTLARVVGIPLVGLIYLGAFGSIFWLDFAYGVVIATWLPSRIVG
jgi:hypothetical protein